MDHAGGFRYMSTLEIGWSPEVLVPHPVRTVRPLSFGCISALARKAGALTPTKCELVRTKGSVRIDRCGAASGNVAGEKSDG